MDQMPNHVKCPEATLKHPAHQRVEAAKEPDAVALKISSAAWHLQLQAAVSKKERASAGTGRAGGSNCAVDVTESASNHGAAHLALLNHPQHMVRDICPGFGPHRRKRRRAQQKHAEAREAAGPGSHFWNPGASFDRD